MGGGRSPSWVPYSTCLYLLCSMTKLKEHSREICRALIVNIQSNPPAIQWYSRNWKGSGGLMIVDQLNRRCASVDLPPSRWPQWPPSCSQGRTSCPLPAWPPRHDAQGLLWGGGGAGAGQRGGEAGQGDQIVVPPQRRGLRMLIAPPGDRVCVPSDPEDLRPRRLHSMAPGWKVSLLFIFLSSTLTTCTSLCIFTMIMLLIFLILHGHVCIFLCSYNLSRQAHRCKLK